MNITNTSSTPPAGAPETTPAQAATTTTTPEPQAGDGQEQEKISLEEAKKLRSEAANLRKRMKAYEEAEAAAQAAKLSETERLAKQHSDLQAKYETETRQKQERIVRYEVERQAIKVGVRPEAADDAAKLLDWSQIEFDEDGTPTNAKKLLEELLKNKPYLAAQQSDGTPSGPPNAPATPAMNPPSGRTHIPSPTSQPPGRIPRLTDPGMFKS